MIFTVIAGMFLVLNANAMPLPSLQLQLGGVLYSPGVELTRAHFGGHFGVGGSLELSRHVTVGLDCIQHSYPMWTGEGEQIPFPFFLLLFFLPRPMSGSHEVELPDGEKVTVYHPGLVNSDLYFRFTAHGWQPMEGDYVKLGLSLMHYKPGDEIVPVYHHPPHPPGTPEPDPVKRGQWQKPAYGLVFGFGGEQPVTSWLTFYGETTTHLELFETNGSRPGIGDWLFAFGFRVGRSGVRR